MLQTKKEKIMGRMIRPRCDSENIVGNGNSCARIVGNVSAQNPDDGMISDEKKELADEPLSEKIPPAGIARVSPCRLCS